MGDFETGGLHNMLYSMIIAPDKDIFHLISTDIFLIYPQKHMLWYSLEAPCRVASNEYPQYMFSFRNRKIICGDLPLIWSCDDNIVYRQLSF